MNIITIIQNINDFTIEGQPDGTFILKTQYGYRYVPHHPINKSFFTCFSDTHWDFLKGGNINFKSEISFQFDNNNIKPQVSDLFEFTIQANVLMNEMLNKVVRAETDFNVLEISPINSEETISSLQECILAANAEN